MSQYPPGEGIYDYVGYYCDECCSFVEYEDAICIGDPDIEGFWCKPCCPYKLCEGCGEEWISARPEFELCTECRDEVWGLGVS